LNIKVASCAMGKSLKNRATSMRHSVSCPPHSDDTLGMQVSPPSSCALPGAPLKRPHGFHLEPLEIWWRWTELNRRPLECHSEALTVFLFSRYLTVYPNMPRISLTIKENKPIFGSSFVTFFLFVSSSIAG
jgi:hypothetical protein